MRRSLRLERRFGWDWTAKKTPILHSSSVESGAVSRLEVLERSSGRRVRSEPSGLGSSAKVCCPALRWRRWLASTGDALANLRLATTLPTARRITIVRSSATAVRPAGPGGPVRGASRSGSQARDCDWRRRRTDGRGDRCGAAVSSDPSGAGVTKFVPGSELKIYIATRPVDFRCRHDELAARCRRCLVSIRSADQPSCSGRNGRTGSRF
ncbi:hypothetical protein ACVIHF_008808 [Bradyrhizobium sp. USDA 4506]